MRIRFVAVPLAFAAALAFNIPARAQTSTRVFVSGTPMSANTSIRNLIGAGPIGFNGNGFAGPLSGAFNGRGPLMPAFNGFGPLGFNPNFGAIGPLSGINNGSGPLAFGAGSTFMGPQGNFPGTFNATQRIGSPIVNSGFGGGGSFGGSFGPNGQFFDNSGNVVGSYGFVNSQPVPPGVATNELTPSQTMGDAVAVSRKGNTVTLLYNGDSSLVAGVVFSILDKNDKVLESKRDMTKPFSVQFTLVKGAAMYDVAVHYTNGSMRRFVSKL